MSAARTSLRNADVHRETQMISSQGADNVSSPLPFNQKLTSSSMIDMVDPGPEPKNILAPQQIIHFAPSASIVAPAMLSGASQAILFNPIDRALYLRVIMRRNLFHIDNWAHPFQGFANAGLHRMLSAGGYLCWQEVAVRALGGRLQNEILERFLVGLIAGSIVGFSLNGLQFVKYRAWTEGSGSFISVTRKLHREAGFRIFLRGVNVSILRDAIFGLTYELLRGKRNRDDPTQNYASHHFLRDASAASVACWMSSPINYCRNIMYGVPPRSCPLGVTPLLHNLFVESMKGGDTWVRRYNIMNSRLNLGWATLRVGIGVAVGQNLFEFYKAQFGSLNKKA